MTRQLPLWASQDSRVIIFFGRASWAMPSHYLFSPGTCQGPSNYFPPAVKSLFLAAQHLCTKHCYGGNIPPDSPEGQPINAESLFFRPGQLGKVESLFFQAGPAGLGRVLYFIGISVNG